MKLFLCALGTQAQMKELECAHSGEQEEETDTTSGAQKTSGETKECANKRKRKAQSPLVLHLHTHVHAQCSLSLSIKGAGTGDRDM